MPEFSIVATAQSETAEAPPSSGRSLGEAVAALRRGEPVLIRDDQISVLAIAAELGAEDSLQRLREISRAPARVVRTRRRAVALGLAPRAELSGALTIWVSPDMPASVIRNLADPGASLGAEPPGFGPAPLVAQRRGARGCRFGETRSTAAGSARRSPRDARSGPLAAARGPRCDRGRDDIQPRRERRSGSSASRRRGSRLPRLKTLA